MLALKIREGGILLIGTTVIRIACIHPQARVAQADIFADPSLPILRFDPQGKLLTGGNSPEETARLEKIVADALVPCPHGGRR